MAVTERPEVLVVRIAPGGANRSSALKVSVFTPISSGTLSLTNWQSATASARSVVVRMRSPAWRATSRSRRPASTMMRWFLWIRSRAPRSVSCRRACSRTS